MVRMTRHHDKRCETDPLESAGYLVEREQSREDEKPPENGGHG